MSSPSILPTIRPLLALVITASWAPACAAPPAAGATYITAEAAPKERTITVGGSARLELVPDEACIEMTIVARDPAISKAHARLRQGVEPLLAELRKTAGLAVEQGAVRYAPEYESDGHGGPSRLVRHAATAQVNVRTHDFARIPEIVGRATEHGLDRVEVVFYSTSIVARKAEVRARALASAQEKARAMAESLGVSLGEVVTIHEGDARMSASVGVGNYLDRGSVDAAPDTPAPPGSIPLFTTVGVVYRVEPQR